MRKKELYYRHPTAIIDKPAKIGTGTKIWHFSHVMSGAVIGKNGNIGQNVFIGGKTKIGNGVKIQNNVSIYDGVILEDYVFCGPSMVFTNDMNPRSKYPKGGHFSITLVKEGASLGANTTIVCGHVIGRHAFIGSGAVVTKDIPDYAMAYGNPARIRGWVCECGEKINFGKNKSAACNKCRIMYKKINNNKIERI